MGGKKNRVIALLWVEDKDVGDLNHRLCSTVELENSPYWQLASIAVASYNSRLVIIKV